jgi:YggT family protein
MIRLLGFLDYLVSIYEYIVIAAIVLSMLIQFNIVNGYVPLVRSINEGLRAVTEPLLRPIRRMLPNTGGLDFAPLVLLLACVFIRSVAIGALADALR